MINAVLRAATAACAVALVVPAFAAAKKPASPAATHATKKKSSPKKEDMTPGPLADFGKAEASDEAVHVANWVSYTHNNGHRPFVLIDKKQARMYVFDAKGKFKGDAPVLLGQAIGDTSAPGVGSKPLSQLTDEEKTTPAGRFVAQPGRNTHGADILWIDYKNAVSMHRVLNVAGEHRFERLASPEIDDNRISNGCVNVPIAFFDKVLKPAVGRAAYVFVLPETKTPQQVFGSRDVTG